MDTTYRHAIHINGDAPPLPPRLNNRCGPIPDSTKQPFWLEDCWLNQEVPADSENHQELPPLPPLPSIPNPGSKRISIYKRLPFELESNRARIDACLREQFRRKPSVRFSKFMEKVQISPEMVDFDESSSSRLYDYPRLKTTQPQPIIKFPEDIVESTITEFLANIIKNTFYPQPMSCPIGLTDQEKEIFCVRLHFVENTVKYGEGWKDFATRVMELDNDDLLMIDDFSCKYKCQVVEVVLHHWHKLDKLKSPKCLKRPANKLTVIQVLRDMEKLDLLDRMNWNDY